MTPKKVLLRSLFWLVALSAAVWVGVKFLGSQDQPMESKILAVFLAFAFCAGIFRWIRRQAKADERLQGWTAEAIEWSDTGISAVSLAFLIMAFILQAFKIPSGSMQPTLLIGDHLFVNKFIYGTQVPFTLKKLWTLRRVERYDVVVFLCPPGALSEEDRKAGVKKDFIKRAVGLPGDRIEIRDKVLYVNGSKAHDPKARFAQETVFSKPDIWGSQAEYQQGWERGELTALPVEACRDNFGPVTVPPGHYFVLGDNRDGSFDSRFWGPLPDRYLKGKAWLVYWPFSRFQTIR